MGELCFSNFKVLLTSAAIISYKGYDKYNGHLWFYDAESVIASLR
jgi:hypothetical protein